jgi:hypothetical protein
MCGTTGYSTRSSTLKPSRRPAGEAVFASSSAFSIFIVADTTVLYWMRS